MIKILATKDKVKWNEVISMLPQKEIFYDCNYFVMNENFSGFIAELFLYKEKNNFFVYPYLKKQISKVLKIKEEYYDITTLEYGGPLVFQKDQDFFDRAMFEFSKYCSENNIVSEFARMHPFFKNHEFISDAQKVKQVYYVDLLRDIEVIKKNLKKSNRNSITKAIKEGVKIIQSKNKIDIDIFYDIYKKTMDRRDASDFYYYSREYFDELFDKLGDKIKLFVAKFNDKIIAASLFLADGDIVQYYLSGMDLEFSKMCPTNVLLFEVINWAKENGYKILNLGAGYKPGDNLSKFKSTFTKTTADFYILKKVHNQKKYDEFTKITKIKDKDYFPIYRG